PSRLPALLARSAGLRRAVHPARCGTHLSTSVLLRYPSSGPSCSSYSPAREASLDFRNIMAHFCLTRFKPGEFAELLNHNPKERLPWQVRISYTSREVA